MVIYVTTGPGLLVGVGLVYVAINALRFLRDEYRVWRSVPVHVGDPATDVAVDVGAEADRVSLGGLTR